MKVESFPRIHNAHTSLCTHCLFEDIPVSSGQGSSSSIAKKRTWEWLIHPEPYTLGTALPWRCAKGPYTKKNTLNYRQGPGKRHTQAYKAHSAAAAGSIRYRSPMPAAWICRPAQDSISQKQNRCKAAPES